MSGIKATAYEHQHVPLECLGPKPHNHLALDRCKDRGTEKGRNFSKVTQLLCGRTGI